MDTDIASSLTSFAGPGYISEENKRFGADRCP